MYVDPNFVTKKALRDAVKEGKTVRVFQPNNFFGVVVPKDGTVAVEGPHYPKPHRWYAEVTLANGRVVKVT